jgi:hypothetical protein
MELENEFNWHSTFFKLVLRKLSDYMVEIVLGTGRIASEEARAVYSRMRPR